MLMITYLYSLLAVLSLKNSNKFPEFVNLDRLLQELVHASSFGFLLKARFYVCRTQANEGYLSFSQVITFKNQLSHSESYLQAVNVRHAVVEQNKFVHFSLTLFHARYPFLHQLYALLSTCSTVILDSFSIQQSVH